MGAVCGIGQPVLYDRNTKESIKKEKETTQQNHKITYVYWKHTNIAGSGKEGKTTTQPSHSRLKQLEFQVFSFVTMDEILKQERAASPLGKLFKSHGIV